VKLRHVGFLSLGIVFGLAAVASADNLIGYTVSYVYQGSGAALDGNGVILANSTDETSTPQSDGSTLHEILLNAANPLHQFKVYVTVHDFAVDQDITYMQFLTHVTGGVVTAGTNGGDYVASALSETSLNPPTMPNGSNLPAMKPFSTNGMTQAGSVLERVRGHLDRLG
jgi:hypothetical protein